MDYIEITDEKGNNKKMEVVCTFKLKEYNFNYIIYSEMDKSHYYIAKYKGNTDDLIHYYETIKNLICDELNSFIISHL